MNARKLTLLLVYVLSVFLSLAVAKRYPPEKRSQGPSTFKTMMRYGRAGNRDEKTRIRPRADAFFLGPRYGKRSSWGIPSSPSAVVYQASAPICGFYEDLSCAYYGISDLYRCTSRKNDFSTATN